MTLPACETLETPRLVLEPLLRSHAALLFDLLQDPELYTYIPIGPPSSIASLEHRHTSLESRRSPDESEAWLNWAARLRTTSAPVGTFQATVRPDGTAFIAYIMFRPYWRQGFAREGCARVIERLFTAWHVERIVAEIDTRNIASLALVEALGFERFAFVERAAFFKGEPSDEYHYQLIRPP